MKNLREANAASRAATLARVRKALGHGGTDGEARAAAQTYIDAHVQGPRPAMPDDLVKRFCERATDMASTIERIGSENEIPRAVARYLDALVLPSALASQKSRSGVCWPALRELDWRGADLDIEARPTEGNDRIGITGTFCAIAETGTLVLVTGPDTPTATALLTDTHIAVVRAQRIVSGMEEAFALVRKECGTTPRAINMISGPSRTGDIEQTIVLGAHGPYRVHILVL